MDRLNALRGTPSPSATAPSPTTSQKDAAEANDFFAALAGGADNITSRRRAPAKAAAPSGDWFSRARASTNLPRSRDNISI